ncbi:DUF924 family protein [Leptothrix discophora]|uniref:DUF924 family protein n=1 Tax=Leptothrix discophora TaxID=89 RepID=A0ABT9G1F3_LEPDI|nr:DUF924 family protein [Leptothrix discophora]MDP4300324.1 DUF924 family protein [Leptothrix discophora]
MFDTMSPVSSHLASAQEVLDFWFGSPDSPSHGRTRVEWFRKDPAFDALIAERFGALVQAALAGGLLDWERTESGDARPALALLIVLDQFPRNLYRGDARAFDGDARALDIAGRLVGAGLDRALLGVERQFVYLPFEHAESLVAQRCAMALFTQLARDEPALAGLVDWARRHHDIVARFGRFPHRNAVLGRQSTAEELEFLQQPGSGF